MFSNFTNPDAWKGAWTIIKEDFLSATWETLYVTLIATLFAIIIGLPIGIILVVGEKGNIMPLPQWLMKVLNVVINLLRSVPFLLLMIMAFPLTRLILGTAIGTTATIPPLVIAAFPFIARLVETSIREVNGNLVEMAQSMGASPWQIIVKVLIPEAIPSLVSNVTLALTTILGYTAMSGSIGGGGLGVIAYRDGYQRPSTHKDIILLSAVILLIILVQIFQTIGSSIALRCDKRIKNKPSKLRNKLDKNSKQAEVSERDN